MAITYQDGPAAEMAALSIAPTIKVDVAVQVKLNERETRACRRVSPKLDIPLDRLAKEREAHSCGKAFAIAPIKRGFAVGKFDLGRRCELLSLAA